jgi:hypothetical protein
LFDSLFYNNLSVSYTLQVPNPSASTQYLYLAGLMRIDMLNGDYTGSLINLLDSAFGRSAEFALVLIFSVSFMSGGSYKLNATSQAFPYYLNVQQAKNEVTNTMGTLIYPFALSLLLPSFIHAIVLEKQERLRELMKMVRPWFLRL